MLNIDTFTTVNFFEFSKQNKKNNNQSIRNTDVKDIFILSTPAVLGGIVGNLNKNEEIKHSEKLNNAQKELGNIEKTIESTQERFYKSQPDLAFIYTTIENNEKSLNDAYEKLDNIMEETNSFNNVEENSVFPELKDKPRGSKKPYAQILSDFDKMTHLKETPQKEKSNCLLFFGKDEKKAKDAIDWFGKASRQNYVTTDIFRKDFDFVEFLEKQEENFKKTGKWNLIHVQNMDKMINPSIVDSAVIAGMKSIMCCSAKDYHSTLLFHTKENLSNLDDIAIESNRVDAFFDIDNMKHFDKFKQSYEEYNKQSDVIDNINKKFQQCKEQLELHNKIRTELDNANAERIKQIEIIDKIKKSKPSSIINGIGKGVAFGAVLGAAALIIKNKFTNTGIGRNKK